MILITGGLGFIGLEVARQLLDRGESVVMTQYRVPRQPEYLKQHFGTRAFVERLDITDYYTLMDIGSRYEIDGICHLAAPDLNVLGPTDEYRTNMTGLFNVLEAARVWKVKRLALASSITVYAGQTEGPFREDDKLRTFGGNPTESFKKTFETLGGNFCDRAGIDWVAMRIGYIYGPLYHTATGNAPSRIVHAAKRGDLDLKGDLFADDAGDYTYVKDCADGIARLQLAESLPNRIYNIGSGRAGSHAELAAAARRVITGPDFPLKPGRGGTPFSRPAAYLDISRIKADVGYEPKYTIESAVADYLGWLTDHEQ